MRKTSIRIAVIALVVACSIGLAWAEASGATKYVALGDSLTAGYMNGGLAEQYNSFPALFYKQLTGRTDGFEQPIVSQPGIPAQLELRGLFPTVLKPKSGNAAPLNLSLARPYDNLGIPGATLREVLDKTRGGIFNLILRNPTLGNTTALQQALVLHPTILTVWVGNNDALGAATSGNPALLTPLENFQKDYDTLINALTATGAQLVLGNIPDVTSIPFVSTIPPILVNPNTNKPVIIGGSTVPLIGPDGTTPLGSADKVLLTASSYLALGCGIPAAAGGVAGLPAGTQAACPTGGLPDNAVLLVAQVATIQARVQAFNTVIRNKAQAIGAGHVDANAVLLDIAAHGIEIGGLDYTGAFLTGGFFSYDGVHPTQLGYAYVTNLFIDAANEAYDLNIPKVDLYPFVFGSGSQASRLPDFMAEGAILSPAAINNVLTATAAESSAVSIELDTRHIKRRGRLAHPRIHVPLPSWLSPLRRHRDPVRMR